MFRLEITFRGMFLFVPDHTERRVHVLLPSMHGHIQGDDPYAKPTYVARLRVLGTGQDLPLEGWTLDFGTGSGADTRLAAPFLPSDELIDITEIAGTKLDRRYLHSTLDPRVIARITLHSGFATRIAGEALWDVGLHRETRLASELTWSIELPSDQLALRGVSMERGELVEFPTLFPDETGRVRVEVSHLPLAQMSGEQERVTRDPADELSYHFAGFYDLLDNPAHKPLPRLSTVMGASRHDLSQVTPVSAVAGLDDGGSNPPTRKSYPEDTPPSRPDISSVAPEPVYLGASAPKQAQPGSEYLVTFAAYVKAFEEQAARRLSHDLEGSPPKLGIKTTAAARWRRGAPVDVELVASGLEVTEPKQSFEWDGEYNALDFAVRVPADAAECQIVLTLKTTIEGWHVGQISLEVMIGKASSGERTSGEARAPNQAFVSYAHKDRSEVYGRVSSLEKYTGDDFFVDRMKLRVGEMFEPKLKKAIVESDAFLLFWSRRARRSEWVEREWTLAIESGKRDDESFQIHLLELVEPTTVPKRLRCFHLDDRWLRISK